MEESLFSDYEVEYIKYFGKEIRRGWKSIAVPESSINKIPNSYLIFLTKDQMRGDLEEHIELPAVTYSCEELDNAEECIVSPLDMREVATSEVSTFVWEI